MAGTVAWLAFGVSFAMLNCSHFLLETLKLHTVVTSFKVMQVGSVADNGSGGSYAYRASKSALNNGRLLYTFCLCTARSSFASLVGCWLSCLSALGRTKCILECLHTFHVPS